MRLSARVWMVAAAMAVMAACVLPLLPGERADAATGGTIYEVRLAEDRFLNFDFSTTTASRTKVDWAIDLLFFGNANINKVKKKLNPWLPSHGGPMYARVNDGTGWVWDTDSGIKTQLCPAANQTAAHMRIYAPPSTDTFWNRSWGYYVIASSHFDHNECWINGEWFGHSEIVEGVISRYASSAWGSRAVYPNYLDTHSFMMAAGRNGYYAYAEGNHIWENNGLATIIRVS